MARGLDRGGGGIDQVGAVRQLGGGDAPLGLGDRGLIAIVLGDGIVELGLGHPMLVEELLRAVEIEGRLLKHGSRLSERGFQHVDLARALHLLLGVGEVGFRFRHARLCRRDLGLLRLALQGEDRRARLDAVAFLHGKRLHAPALLRAHQHEVGLHVAGENIRLTIPAAGERAASPRSGEMQRERHR